MPKIGIKVLCSSEEDAEERVEKDNEDDATLEQKVTEDGNYFRKAEIPYSLYDWFVEMTEEDNEAKLQMVEI